MYKVTELSEFYKEIETDKQLTTEKPSEPRTEKFSNDLKSKDNGAQGLIYLGDMQKKVAEEFKAVDKMLKDVANNVTGALQNLIGKFSSEGFGAVVFKLPKKMLSKDGELLDDDGQPIHRYGVKVLETEEQRERLKKNVEIAMLYLPDLQMKEIKSADGKNIAIVSGADSAEFNAVVKAHRARENLQKESHSLAAEKKNLMVKMGLNPETEIRSAGAPTLVEPQAQQVAVAEQQKAGRGV